VSTNVLANTSITSVYNIWSVWGTNILLTLPPASTNKNILLTFIVANTNANSTASCIVTNFNGSDLVAGSLAQSLSINGNLTVVSDGTNWIGGNMMAAILAGNLTYSGSNTFANAYFASQTANTASISNAQFLPAITFTNPTSGISSKLGVGASTNSLVLTNQFGDRQLAINTNQSPIVWFGDGVVLDGSGGVFANGFTGLDTGLTNNAGKTLLQTFTDATNEVARLLTGNNKLTGTNQFGGVTIFTNAGSGSTVVNLGLDANNNLVSNSVPVGGSGSTGVQIIAGAVSAALPSATRYTWPMGPLPTSLGATESLASGITPGGVTLIATNLYIKLTPAIQSTTNVVVTIMTNGVATGLTCTLNGDGANTLTNSGTTSATIPASGTISLRTSGSSALASSTLYFVVEVHK
jgi:hypothetical protein